jgi:hypothetical protein
MKDYPTIPRAIGQSFREFDASVFAKLDGSNIRMELVPKRGSLRFGSRHRLLDETDDMLGQAIPLFRDTMVDPLLRIARSERWESVVAYAEFFGPSSFAGVHDPAEPKQLVLFDLNVYKRGILPPRDYLKLVERTDIPHAEYLGSVRWTRGFVERVRIGDFEGMPFEGVVGKGVERNLVVMSKAKTQAWLNAVTALYAPAEARRIIES